jgi:predicted phage tail protein
MLKKVTLYGELAEKYGKDWSLDVNSPGEAFKALDVNNIGFRQFVASSEERGVGYKVIVGKSYINDYSELGHPSGRQEIKIIPVILGAKNKGLGMVLMGVAIITGFYIYGEAYLAMGGGEAMGIMDAVGVGVQQAGTFGSLAMKFAGSLILGGVAAMLAPTPEAPDTADKPTNYGFDGATNTARQGYAIPVAYGQLLIGGAVISSGISPEDYTP